MSVRGVWQCQRILLRYCGGSVTSATTRDYIRNGLAEFAAANPQLTIDVQQKARSKPLAVGFYLDGTRKEVELTRLVKAADISKSLAYLRNAGTGRVRNLDKPVVSRYPSIQGAWDPSLSFTAVRVHENPIPQAQQ